MTNITIYILIAKQHVKNLRTQQQIEKLLHLINATLYLITNSKSSLNIADMQNITTTDLDIFHSKFWLLHNTLGKHLSIM